MNSRRWTWILLGLLVAAGFVLFTRHQLVLQTHRAGGGGPVAGAAKIAPFKILSTNTPATLAVEARTNRLWRLSNTTRTLAELGRDPHAILLANALIDTRAGLGLAIPDKLRAKGDPKAYIVQAHGPISPTFRAMLASSGGQVVSYIPNNAYLVMMDQAAAEGIQGLGFAVVPYEPYYKVASSLLPWMNQPLPSGATLNVEVFPGTGQDAVAAIQASGGTVLSQTPSQNGTILNVLPPADWTAVADLPYLHIVEPSSRRVPANDLARATVSVAPNSQTTSNYMGLSGSNVLVEVNDSGIDAKHPDFKTWGNAPIRVIGDAAQSLVDTDGHGTHVAGIIAGDGFESMTVSNAQGSILPATNGQFRGMAPNATLYSVGGVYGGGDTNPISDMYLQEAPALTNALISNNSWVYGGDEAYDLAAASYDAAVRDALPLTTGSQPVLFVFAAGDEGNGDDSSDPGAGTADTVDSPGTAKNVITVGAIQEDRNITNQVTNAVGTVSEPWQAETSTGYRIAGFSSRGNVGINTEGVNGRFKPDVVAPGTFIISTRSEQWDINSYFASSDTNNAVVDLTVEVPGNTLSENDFPTIPTNTVEVTIDAVPDANSPTPFPALPIYTWRFGGTPLQNMYTNEVTIPPDNPTLSQILVDEQTYISAFPFAISNSTPQPIEFDIIEDTVTTNNPGNYELVLSNLDLGIGAPNPASTGAGPYYRYETGTSMSAANVSGVLADMADYFTNTLRLTPSPALLKAMLINGARPTGEYGLQVANSINYEGWGLANLTNSVPAGLTNQIGAGCSEFILDQNPTNALATGGSHTYLVNITSATAQTLLPLRVTLAWTDPPGDPAAAIKLVNNLDLVVTNYGANPPIVYYGNDISSGDFNNPHGTNDVVAYDYVNNVKNVYISQPVGTNYSITVLARDVNVNAVTANSNNVVQDFALVISSGEGEVTNAMTVADGGQLYNPTGDQDITYIVTTNAPLMDQFAGASTPLLGTNQADFAPGSPYAADAVDTLGMTNQWHFYVVTNSQLTTNGLSLSNAAFITFLPNTLSIPRIGVYQPNVDNATTPGADIDLYVTTDSNLLTLSPVTISNCINGTQIGASAGTPPVFNGASLSLSGTQFVVDTNSTHSQVYYIGVYSERQMAAEYDFLSVFTSTPFSEMNNGNQIVNGIPLPNNIPDGDLKNPGYAYTFGLALYPMEVGQVIVDDSIWHQNYGDLIGTLNHNGTSVVLNNHDDLGNPPGPYNLAYSDGGITNVQGAILSDGPGSLQSFFGSQGIGVWMMTEADTALTHTGYVAALTMTLVPYTPLTHGINVTVEPGSWVYTFQDVPVGYTNLTVVAEEYPPESSPPLQLYVNYGSDPTFADTNEEAWLTNDFPVSGGPVDFYTNYVSVGPPLAPGTYYVGIYNPSLVAANVHIYATLAFSQSAITNVDYEGGPTVIPDDAVSYSSILVANPSLIQSLSVGIAVADTRISDLVFQLISPNGTRYLLMENEGGMSTSGAGISIVETNITTVVTNYTVLVTNTVVVTNNFEGMMAADFAAGATIGGWTVTTNEVSVVTDPTNAYQGTNLLALANGGLSYTFPSTITNGAYTFTFAYRGPAIAAWWRAESNTVESINGNNGTISGEVGYSGGEVGEAFQFYGDNSGYVLVSNSPSLNVGAYGSGITLECWIKDAYVNAANGPMIEYSMASPSPIGDGPELWSGINLFSNLRDTSGNGHTITSPNGLFVTSRFQHAAVTYDKVSGAARLYVDGTMVASNNFGYFTPETAYPFVSIGQRISQTVALGETYQGLTDELSVYGRALSDAEIAAINNLGTRGKFDAGVFSNSPALSLAEASVNTNGRTVVINGNNTTWQTFTASGNLPTNGNNQLIITGTEPGMLLDSLIVSNFTVTVSNVFATLSVTNVTTNFLYLTFTENTNLTTTPIKFAPTPFVPSGAVSNVFFDGFETTAAGDYTNGQTFGNRWTVISNEVSVVTDPTNAYAGSNFLALASGVISNNLPTVAGQTYTLSFAYRGPGIVGWWRGESNTLDSSGFNNNGTMYNGGSYTNGEVGSAFSLLGTDMYVGAPGNSTLNVGTGPGMTIEGWINPSVLNTERFGLEWDNGSAYGPHLNISTGPGTGPYGTGAGCLYANYIDTGGGDHWLSSAANLVQAGSYQHVATTYNQYLVQGKLYYNGAAIVPVNYYNWSGKFTPQTTPGYNVNIGWRVVNASEPSQWNGLDEMSVYNRTLSASEIKAIYQKGGEGKFDHALFASSPALSLSEAGISLNGGTPAVINGNNMTWQVYTTTFTATQSGTPLEITGLEPGMLLDNFTVTSVANNLYYQPDQDISSLDNTSAQGLWQLEIQDDRVGATNPPPELLSWQLQFTFANTNLTSLPILNPGQPTSGTVAGTTGGDPISWYQVNVPAGAAAAFNLLLSASGSVNLVYSTNNPPTTGFPGDALLIGSATNGVSTLTPTNYPPLVPAGVYYLGVQNTNGPSVNYTIEVNFASSLQPAPISGGQPVTNTINGGTNSFTGGDMDYYAITVPPNADFATNLLLFATGPVNVWFNQATLPAGGHPPDDALFSSSTGGAVVLSTNGTPPLVPGQTYYLAVQNTNAANVTYAIEVNFHLVLPPSNGVAWIQVNVPTNADWATNDLISATAPVDLWWTTNTPPTTNNNAVLLLPDATYPTGTNGLYVLGTNTTPAFIVPGGSYWLGVETNGLTTYNVQVYFHLVPPPPPVTNGIAWTTIAVPTNADLATNFLISSTAPVDLWWSTNVPPTTNGTAVLLLPDGTYPTGTNGFVVLGTNPPPPFIVPGGTYYLGVQTNGITTYNIAVKFHLVPPPPPTNLVAIVYTNIAGKIGYLLSWYGPTNDLFQVQWAGSLAPPVAWNAFTNVITYTTYLTPNNSLFQFFDDGSQTGGFGLTRFYRLEVLGVFTNSPPVFLATPPNQNVYALSTVAITNAATNPDLPNPLTYALIAPPAGMSISSNGVILWMPTLAQTNHVYTITTVVTDTNPYVQVNQSLSATNSFSLTVLPPYTLGTGQTQSSRPQTNSLTPGGLTWYEVSVPVNADYATNILLYANPQPVNVWFSTNLPPSISNPGDLTLLSSTTGGQAVIATNNGTPLLPAGATYWLGVQNTGSATVNYAIAVNFHLVIPPPPIDTLYITNTVIGGKPGFLLSWYGATNDLFQLQWAASLTPPVAWNAFSNIIAYTTYITPSNSLFQFFDDGSQTGGFGSARLYRLELLGLATNLPPVFVATPPNQTIFALSALTVTNNATDVYSPPQVLTYTLPGAPAGMTISPAGVITWTPTAAQESTTNLITTVVFNNGLPPLGATNTFQVIVLPIPGPAAFTAPATWVTGTNAELNGFASPNGTPSLAWFQWGPNPLFTNQTAPVNVGNGYGVVWVTNTIANLLDGHGYYFRLVVSNAVGAAYGADQEFSDGSIVGWGDNSSEQLITPAGLTNLVAIAAGEYHTLALNHDGTVAVWGDDSYEQTNIPPGLSNVVAVSAGVYYSLALAGDGTVVGWGDNTFGQLNVPTGLSNVVAIAAGYDHSVALQSNGTVTVWGDNTYGQTNIPPGLGNVVTIAAGWSHTLAVENNGTVVAWGYGFDGETNVPANLTNAVAVAGGAEDSLALRSDGTVKAWGDDFFGETSIPAGLNSVQAIAAGDYHNLALRSDGTVIAWGDGTGGDTNVPSGLSNVVMVAGGGYFGLALQAAVTTPLVIPNLKNVTWANNSITLQWTAPTYESFQVQWTPALPATSWTTVPGLITSATGVFQFVDNGSLTAPLGTKRFYRLIVQ